jgi:hypothetical protein
MEKKNTTADDPRKSARRAQTALRVASRPSIHAMMQRKRQMINLEFDFLLRENRKERRAKKKIVKRAKEGAIE